MLQILCPYCGTRDEPEFSFGGQAGVARPDYRVEDSVWTTYLFVRDNPKGIHLERWCHSYGCGRWFDMARNTLTHEILAVHRLAAPDTEAPAQPDRASRSA